MNLTEHNLYDIDVLDSLIIESKHTSLKTVDDIPFLEGLWKIKILSNEDTIIGINFYIPEYVSNIFKSVNLQPLDTTYYSSIICNNNELSHPFSLNTPFSFLKFYDNGFQIKKEQIKIHPAMFFNKVVGLMIITN